jgi:hypothetical protein
MIILCPLDVEREKKILSDRRVASITRSWPYYPCKLSFFHFQIQIVGVITFLTRAGESGTREPDDLCITLTFTVWQSRCRGLILSSPLWLSTPFSHSFLGLSPLDSRLNSDGSRTSRTRIRSITSFIRQSSRMVWYCTFAIGFPVNIPTRFALVPLVR